jgi:hypothetical protein
MSPMDNYHRSYAVKVLSQLVENNNFSRDELARRVGVLMSPKNPEVVNEIYLIFLRALSGNQFKNVVFAEDIQRIEVLLGFLIRLKHDNGTIAQMFK